MERSLETVALFSLKLTYESEDQSPILRDDPVMADYQREVFSLLVRQLDINAVKLKVGQCLDMALTALGGAETVMGRELQKLSSEVRNAPTLEPMHPALLTLKDYLKAVH